MCLIVDASRLGDCLAEPVKPDTEPILKWIRRGGRLIYSTGGQYGNELDRSPHLKRKLRDWVQAGRARLVPSDQFLNDEHALASRTDLRSNDPHILALARHSGARVLYTGDGRLMDDFKNKSLIDGPRGRIYSGAANKRLLTSRTCAR